jgi:deazaflavin-dependent oxidoreductase (nitroreductase family)
MDIIDTAVIAESLPDFSKAHIRRYLESKGKVGHLTTDGSPPRPENVSSLILATKGRNSGKYSLTPLYYGTDGDKYVLIASKGGDAENPGWYKNLSAHPQVRIQVGDKRLDATAKSAAGEERTRLWNMMQQREPLYREYQAKTQRQIPVVLLTPLK